VLIEQQKEEEELKEEEKVGLNFEEKEETDLLNNRRVAIFEPSELTNFFQPFFLVFSWFLCSLI
jgi:hypothetical protein